MVMNDVDNGDNDDGEKNLMLMIDDCDNDHKGDGNSDGDRWR